MAAPAWTTPRRQSYDPLLCQHADSGNWRKLTIATITHGFPSTRSIFPYEGKNDDDVRAAMGDKFPKHIYHSIIGIGALVARQEGGHWIVKCASIVRINALG